MTLHEFLFDQLHANGVRQVFGIPGDFVLNLYNALQQDQRFRLIALTHEPAVGFAADGASRITNGLGVCLVTYGAGGLNMINSIACAYAEESPLIVISGGPGRIERDAGLLVHHEVKSFESQFKIYQEVVGVRRDHRQPADGRRSIHRAIDVALKFKRPVYLEIPRDMVFADIVIPQSFDEVELKVNESAVAEAAAEIIDHLSRAERPGTDCRRRGSPLPAHRPGDSARRAPADSGDVIVPRPRRVSDPPPPVHRHLSRGGEPSADADARRRVRLSAAARRTPERRQPRRVGRSPEGSRSHHGRRTRCLHRPASLRAHAARAGRRAALLGPRSSRFRDPIKAIGTDVSPEVFDPFKQDEAIKVRHAINLLNEFVREHDEMPLIADTGDVLFASVDIRANQCIAPAYYGTMGFSVPAALGVQIASGRRPLVLVGDGAFQMTGGEISQARRYGCNPIVVLFNNQRWEMLQAFFPDATYNETVSWPFAKLADLWGGRGFRAFTPRQLRDALNAAYEESRFTVIEVGLQQGDVSPILRGFVEAFKKRVYV